MKSIKLNKTFSKRLIIKYLKKMVPLISEEKKHYSINVLGKLDEYLGK